MVFPFLFSIIAALISSDVAAHADYSSELIDKARAKRLADTQQWRNLLHYQTRVFGGYKSQADSQSYFFAPDGKTNPQAELEATIKAFFVDDPKLMSDGKVEEEKESDRPQHPQCRFPARFLFFKRELGLDPAKLPAPKCERFRTFRDTIAAKSATVVFSSYYLNNPSSAFGHSFLRLNKADASFAGQRYELLDYGINYAANVNTGNALVYAISGVAGLFPGQFTSVPYYHKVREYNDYESRDLWEYDLNLTQPQIDMIVAHAWELGQATFNYYYLDENCSYHVLTLIDAGAPELNLARRLGPIVIPVDSIKVLTDTPGLVRKIHFRASGRMQFLARLKSLNPSQRAYLRAIIGAPGGDTPEAPAALDQKQKVESLDTAIDFVDYRYSSDLFKPETMAAQWKQKLLLTRARIPVPSQELQVEAPASEMPHLGHDSRRLGVDYGYGTLNHSDTRFSFRYALHDLLDQTTGYPGYAQMEIFNARVRYTYDTTRWQLDDFALIQVTSLSPLSDFNKSRSWRVKMGARTIRDYSCDECLAGNLLLGAGYTVGPAFAFLDGEIAGSPDFDRFPVRPGIGPSVGLRILATDKWLNLAHAAYRYQFPTHSPHYFEFGFESRFGLTRALALNAKWIRYPVAHELSSGLLYYF